RRQGAITTYLSTVFLRDVAILVVRGGGNIIITTRRWHNHLALRVHDTKTTRRNHRAHLTLWRVRLRLQRLANNPTDTVNVLGGFLLIRRLRHSMGNITPNRHTYITDVVSSPLFHIHIPLHTLGS